MAKQALSVSGLGKYKSGFFSHTIQDSDISLQEIIHLSGKMLGKPINLDELSGLGKLVVKPSYLPVLSLGSSQGLYIICMKEHRSAIVFLYWMGFIWWISLVAQSV